MEALFITYEILTKLDLVNLTPEAPLSYLKNVFRGFVTNLVSKVVFALQN